MSGGTKKTSSSKFIGFPDVMLVRWVNRPIRSLQHTSFNKCFHLYVDAEFDLRDSNKQCVNAPAAFPPKNASALVCES
jgi:hypothetical protein